ncbi:MAG: hypothetical protein K5890_05380 [Bacteroidales bacterium]|nr:hypothetical protein [Bacteroidales bacterium]
MKKTNVIKPLVLCLFCLLAITGCQKKYPSVYEYTGVWDFRIHLYPSRYDDSNHYYIHMPDTIINYTGRIAYEGGSLLLIEFNQNECMEAILAPDGKIWPLYNGHDYYSEQARCPFGEFIGTENIKMYFSITRGNYRRNYNLTGSKRN